MVSGAAGQDGGMRDSQYGGQNEGSSDELNTLARSVVARIAARGDRALRPLDTALVAAIVRASTSSDPDPFDALRPDVRRMRIGEVDLAETYLPAAARLLGCNWADDIMSFAEVTIGMARLQSWLHAITRDWSSSASPSADPSASGEAVLVVLPEGEQHSFGVQVLASHLRRQGVSVKLQIGARPDKLHSMVQGHHYDCALVSVSCEEKLEFCRKVVKSLKDGSRGSLLVAVGGAVTERPVDVQGLTGADLVTNDPLEALAAARQSTGRNSRARIEQDGAHHSAPKERLDEL